MAPRKNEIVKESYHTLILCCFFICEIKKITTNNKKLLNSYICHSGCPNYQITAIVFFNLRSVGEGWFEVDYLINSLQKNRQPPGCIVKFLQILCSSCIHLILVILYLSQVKIFEVERKDQIL
jgi:predicted NACHT family NTPase